MNEIYGGLSSSPVNKIDVAMSGDRTITFGGTVVETPIKVPEKIVLATISLQTDPALTGTVSGGGRFIAGTSITVVATPDSESEYPDFDGWYEGETKVSENASYTFTVSGARTLVAKFKEASDPTAIDLGLPSGRKWRSMNLGATAPEEAGLYYSWGNAQGHTASEGYEWGTDNEGSYAQTTGAGLTGDIPANATYDAAVAALGGKWRMPTNADFEELINNCDWTWKQVNGVNGYEVKSKASGNTNSIFLPAAGYGEESSIVAVGSFGFYWSSSINSDDTDNAWYLNLCGGDFFVDDGNRYVGCSVRPVQ